MEEIDDRIEPESKLNGLIEARVAAMLIGRANAGGFVNIFFQIRVEHMLQQAGKTVVVFWHNKDQCIGFVNGCRKFWIFESLTGIID